MKMRRNVLVGVLILLATTAASAKDSSFREQVVSSSRSQGLERSLQVLARIAGPGRDARAAQVLSQVEASIPLVAGKAVKETRQFDDSIMVQGEGFVVDVRGDGSWVRFELLDRARSGVSINDKMSSEELASLGRRFVERDLAGQIVVADCETLELWSTSYEIEVQRSDAGEALGVRSSSSSSSSSWSPCAGGGRCAVVSSGGSGTTRERNAEWLESTPK